MSLYRYLRPVAGAAAWLFVAPALAQPAPPEAGSEPNFMANLWSRETLLGDLGGLRTTLGEHGITIDLTDNGEVFANLAGGIRRGAIYDALTTLTLKLDTEKAFGWAGGRVNISALNIRGRSLSTNYLGVLQTATGIEATNSTRLWEIWYEQLLHDGHLSVKVGQQSVDEEFMLSESAGLFLNSAMGWPVLTTVDLYAGGPSYPLSSLGVRLKGEVTDEFTILGGVFQDNPPGGPFNDDGQLRGSTRWGGNFNLRTGALAIVELQYAVNQPPEGDAKDAPPPSGLPATYKLGIWYDSAPFPSQRYDNTGLSLANPASTGVPKALRNNIGFYGVVDQTVWRPDPQGKQAISVFARLIGTPRGDRNLVNFSVIAGATLKAPFAARDKDAVGLGFGIARISGAASGLDQDTEFYSGSAYPVRSSETFIEATYQAQLAPWLQVQPDLQYFVRPGGGIPEADDPNKRIANAFVLGVRTNIKF